MDELEVLRIRDEVLQAMYWMRSEGIDERPDFRPSMFGALSEPEGGLVQSRNASWLAVATEEESARSIRRRLPWHPV